MEALLRFIEFVEKIILKIIDKMNFVTIMLILVILGFMNKSEVFEWFKIIGSAFKGASPF